MFGDWKRACTSRTLVDSAFAGSQAFASFFCAPVSFPASGNATISTMPQKATTSHLVQLPAGTSAILRALPIDTPLAAGYHAVPTQATTGSTVAQEVSVLAEHFVLVPRASLRFGQEQLPHPGTAEHPRGVHATVPAVEVAHHAHRLGVGGPHRERGAGLDLTTGADDRDGEIARILALGARTVDIGPAPSPGPCPPIHRAMNSAWFVPRQHWSANQVCDDMS